MATFVNDLRLTELATGEGSGTWGTTTNTNLELIAESFSFGTEAITTNADTHTTTIADGSTDPGRSLFLKYTGTLDSACTITIGPNTVSKLWFIENATSGSQSIIIKQGSGSTITIPNGQTKAIYSDGAGSGGAMVDAFQDLSIPDLFVDDDLTVGDDLILSSDGAIVKFGADADTTLTHTDGTGLTLNSTNKLTFGDAASFVQQSSDGVLRIDGEATIDLNASTAVTVSNDLKLDSDSAVLGFGADNDTTLTHTDGSGLTLNSTNKIMFNDASQFIQGSSATVLSLGATDEIDLTATAIDINGTVDMSSTLAVAGKTTLSLGSSDGTSLELKNTSNVNGSQLTFFNDSSSPADDDRLGQILFNGDDSAGNETTYVRFRAESSDVTDGSEDGKLQLSVVSGGSLVTPLQVGIDGVVVNEFSTSAQDFRVESDSNTHMLFVDAGNDRVMVGKSSTGLANQGVEFEDGQIKGTATGQTVAFLNRASDDGTVLDLRKDNTTFGTISKSSTRFTIEGPDNPVRIVTGTSNIQINHDTHISFDTAGSEAARIDSSGNFFISTTEANPHTLSSGGGTKFFDSSGSLLAIARDSSTVIAANRSGSSAGTVMDFRLDGTIKGDIGVESTGMTINDGSSDLDFRVESNGNTNAIFVDAGNDRVGILNDASMGSNFNVLTQMSIGADNNNRGILDFSSGAFSIGTIQSGTSTFSTFSVSSGAVFCNNSTSLGTSLILNNTSNGSGSTLKFLNDSSSPADDDVLGSIDFNGNDSAGTQTTFARIRAGSNNVTNGSEDGFMAFAVSNDASILEHLRVNTAGVVVNELSQANTDFRVESNDNTHMLVVDSGANSIGINASNPTHPIDITANSSAHGVRIRGRSADDIGELNFQSNDGGTAHSQLQSLSTELKIRNIANIPMSFHTNNTERARITEGGDFLVGSTTVTQLTSAALTFDVSQGRLVVTADGGTTEPLILNRHDSDGTLIEFRQANTVEGTISVSGSTVSYNGFSGSHDSSGIPSDTELGTVCSTIDELDTYPDTRKDLNGNDEDHPKKGQTRPDHAKIKVSDSVGDARVYGVLGGFQKDGKPVVNSVGIGSIKVTGACSGGDLLESNGDGTAKVQSDDIIRSKTIGKVTIGNSTSSVKLVSCVLYCG